MASSRSGRPRVAVIGGGVGGLAVAIRLAARGAEVTIYERAARVGGKLREVDVGGLGVDAGPSVMTMPFIFEELFACANTRLQDHLTLSPVEPACRHFFADGSRLDLSNDPRRSREAIRAFAGEAEARGFDRFSDHARKIFEIVRGPFMESKVPSLSDLWKPAMLFMMPRFLQIDSTRTLWEALGSFFRDPRLRQLYGRYATYNGSSPFHCPATLAVICHVEQAFGIHAVRGGLYRLAEALAGIAAGLGVTIRCGAQVERIRITGGRVSGLVIAGETLAADAVVANCDAAQLFGRLLDDPAARKLRDRVQRLEPSLSAYVLLARAKVGDFPLAHHNVFFSADYAHEFAQLFDQRPGHRRPPDEPTVYLCAQDRVPFATPPADGAERHLLLSNAPAIELPGAAGSGLGRPLDWRVEGAACRRRLLTVLERHGLTLTTTAEHEVTPAMFEELFPQSRGSIYGASSNAKLAAFERPANRVPGYQGLYLVGGSAHPGAGMPMVALSAKIAAGEAATDLGLARSSHDGPYR